MELRRPAREALEARAGRLEDVDHRADDLARRHALVESLAVLAPAQEKHVNKNMRAFIVDDYTTMLRILRNLLRQLEIYNVEEANDGETAFQMIQKSPPDLIISDWNMTPMTGLDLLRKVRADAKLRHIWGLARGSSRAQRSTFGPAAAYPNRARKWGP